MLPLIKKFYYGLLALIAAAVFLLAAAWLPNWALLKFTLFSGDFSPASKLAIIGGSWQWLLVNSTPVSAGLTVLSALLFGANVSLLAYYLKQRIAFCRPPTPSPFAKATGDRRLRRAHLGIFGAIASFFGIGCAACGSFLFSAIFGLAAGSALTAALPLGGQEFSWIGVAILSATLYGIARQIKRPLVCRISNGNK